MEIEHALVTSSALPDQIRASENFVELDQDQLRDLVDYSRTIEPKSSKEKLMVLVVAHGTPEQEAAEKARLEEEEQRKAALEEEELKKEEQREQQERDQARRRARSKELLNGLYGR